MEAAGFIRTPINDLLARADLIDEASDTLYYMGYLARGADDDTSQANCYIIRYQKTGNIWKKLYASGNMIRDKVFDNRATYTYKPLQ